ncbi:dihydroorotate dehydrogenase, partial [Methylobacterium radiotolerans]
MPLIYKICPRALWREAEAAGRFTGAPVDHQDGFIHFSTAAQVAETAAR